MRFSISLTSPRAKAVNPLDKEAWLRQKRSTKT
jgi:hypothetical protein